MLAAEAVTRRKTLRKYRVPPTLAVLQAVTQVRATGLTIPRTH
jgi:hypothetical protein